MNRATVAAISRYVCRADGRQVVVGFHQGQGYMVTFDDSIRDPRMQTDLAGIMFRWVNSTAIHCPLEFAERVAQEVEDATA